MVEILNTDYQTRIILQCEKYLLLVNTVFVASAMRKVILETL